MKVYDILLFDVKNFEQLPSNQYKKVREDIVKCIKEYFKEINKPSEFSEKPTGDGYFIFMECEDDNAIILLDLVCELIKSLKYIEIRFALHTGILDKLEDFVSESLIGYAQIDLYRILDNIKSANVIVVTRDFYRRFIGGKKIEKIRQLTENRKVVTLKNYILEDKEHETNYEFYNIAYIKDETTFGLKLNDQEITKIKLDLNKEYASEEGFSSIDDENSFQLLSVDIYREIGRKLEDFSKKPIIVDPVFVQNIKLSLEEQGVAFIAGPILFGKTFYSRYIHEKFNNYKFITDIPGEKLRQRHSDIISLHNLFYVWFRNIALNLLHRLNIDLFKLDNSLYKRIEVETDFLIELERNRSAGDSDIKCFLKSLSIFLDDLKFEEKVLVAFHLDDIHKYIGEDIFRELRRDLINFTIFPEELAEWKIRVLVTTRYFPSNSGTSKTINIIPYFDKQTIFEIAFYLLKTESDKANLQLITNTIHKKTEGYPWLVMRFFKIYIERRIQMEKCSPEELLKKIFVNESYWTTDILFGHQNQSEFLRHLSRLVVNSTPTMKENFKKFIETESTQIGLNNGFNTKDDFLIQQSGFAKIDLETGDFDNNGCYIMKEYFQKKIINDL